MTFDYIIENPPYKGSLHLDFLIKSLDILNNAGKLTIIEPATWLINLRDNGKSKLYDEIKRKIDGHVSKVIIENCNNEFNVGLSLPCSITYIDMSESFPEIEYICCGYKSYVKSIYDCNLIGNHQLIRSIFDKISAYDKMANHVYNNKQTYPSNTCYAAIAKNMRGGIGDPRFSDEWFVNNQYRCYYYHCFNEKEPISDKPHHLLCTGYTYENPKYKDEESLNICGTYDELENFRNFVYNNKLCLFLNLCIILDMSPCSIANYVPWIADRQYTDDEIKEMFGFTDDEDKLMDNTICKFSRTSPWFNRFMKGKSALSNNEVQAFINEYLKD